MIRVEYRQPYGPRSGWAYCVMSGTEVISAFNPGSSADAYAMVVEMSRTEGK